MAEGCKETTSRIGDLFLPLYEMLMRGGGGLGSLAGVEEDGGKRIVEQLNRKLSDALSEEKPKFMSGRYTSVRYPDTDGFKFGEQQDAVPAMLFILGAARVMSGTTKVVATKEGELGKTKKAELPAAEQLFCE